MTIGPKLPYFRPVCGIDHFSHLQGQVVSDWVEMKLDDCGVRDYNFQAEAETQLCLDQEGEHKNMDGTAAVTYVQADRQRNSAISTAASGIRSPNSQGARQCIRAAPVLGPLLQSASYTHGNHHGSVSTSISSCVDNHELKPGSCWISKQAHLHCAATQPSCEGNCPPMLTCSSRAARIGPYCPRFIKLCVTSTSYQASSDRHRAGPLFFSFPILCSPLFRPSGLPTWHTVD